MGLLGITGRNMKKYGEYKEFFREKSRDYIEGYLSGINPSTKKLATKWGLGLSGKVLKIQAAVNSLEEKYLA